MADVQEREHVQLQEVVRNPPFKEMLYTFDGWLCVSINMDPSLNLKPTALRPYSLPSKIETGGKKVCEKDQSHLAGTPKIRI